MSVPIQGGKIVTGGSLIESEGNFVQPTIVEISSSAPIVKEELFGPVLYVMKFQVQPTLLCHPPSATLYIYICACVCVGGGDALVMN